MWRTAPSTEPFSRGLCGVQAVAWKAQKRVFGGCHLSRPVVDLLTTAGFTITALDVYEEGTPKVLGADSLGAALSP